MPKLTRIEEVKKILGHFRQSEYIDQTSYQAGINADSNLGETAKEICQLFPQPLEDKELEGCKICGGSGQKRFDHRTYDGQHSQRHICLSCNGTGKAMHGKGLGEILDDYARDLKTFYLSPKADVFDYAHEEYHRIRGKALALLQPKIEHLLDQLKLADKNYLELKNAFDERIEEAKRQMCQDCAYKQEHNERVLANPRRCIITKKK